MIDNLKELERGELLSMLREIYDEIQSRRMADLVDVKEMLDLL